MDDILACPDCGMHDHGDHLGDGARRCGCADCPCCGRRRSVCHAEQLAAEQADAAAAGDATGLLAGIGWWPR